MAMLPILTPIEHIGEPLSLARQLPLQCHHRHQKPLADFDCRNLATASGLVSLIDSDAERPGGFSYGERLTPRVMFHA
jgi:hypothetical protein